MNIIKHEINIIQTKTKDTKDIALRPLNSSLNTNKIRKKLEITEEMNWKKQIKFLITFYFPISGGFDVEFNILFRFNIIQYFQFLSLTI